MRSTFLFFAFFFAFLVANAQQFSGGKAQTNNQNLPIDSVNKGSIQINGDYRVHGLLQRYKEENEGKQIEGYRIQLYSGNRTGAFNLKKGFVEKMPETDATVVYESPDFKLQVGNYRTKLEAEKAMETIWPLFKSAFVVKTKIDLPKLPTQQKSK